MYFNLSKSYSLNDLSTADIRPNNSAVGILRNSSEAINDGALEVTKRGKILIASFLSTRNLVS